MSQSFIEDPYERFAIAMIQRAVEDCKVKKKMIEANLPWLDPLATDPEYWLFESDDKQFPSFIALCNLMDLNYVSVRKRIREYLMEHDITVGMSAVERLRRKIKQDREIMRYKLVLWAWRKMGVKTKSLSKLLDILIRKGEVEERKRRGEAGRTARHYHWVGDK